MKHFLTVLFISAGIFGWNTANAQQLKIGYIDADEIIMLMPEAAQLQAHMQEYQTSLYQNAQDKQTSFNEAVDKFIKDSVDMSPSLKEVKRGELAKMSQELAQQEQIIAQQLDAKRAELALPIQQKLKAAIDEIAKANGYTYVFTKEALIVWPDKDDLGPLVMKKLNLKKPEAPATPAAPSGN
ncbi:MAG: OmpH family outer membrane protein [Chitinophagaceae bacterium]|nr:OmpH family outer membrane protein [Chitinophagaceae bacterium]